MTDRKVSGADHQADPATYDCRSCDRAWPCDPAREYLLSTTPDPVQLNIRLWTDLEKAAGVLRHEPPAVLFERFLKWTDDKVNGAGMTDLVGDAERRAAVRVAITLADCGFAFIEDDRIDVLALSLRAFLATAGIRTSPAVKPLAGEPPVAVSG